MVRWSYWFCGLCIGIAVSGWWSMVVGPPVTALDHVSLGAIAVSGVAVALMIRSVEGHRG